MDGIPASSMHVSRTTHGWKTGSADSLTRESPTKVHSSPTSIGVALSGAEATALPWMWRGSYWTKPKLCVGWRKRTAAATSTVDANSTRTSPGTTGIVLRSTRTRPSRASTTTPAPTYLSDATPSIWYGMSKRTRTRAGVTACTLGGPARVNVTACGTGTGAGGGAAHLAACHWPVRSSRV